MFGEKLSPGGGHGDEVEAILPMPPDEAALIGILPHRKSWAGGAPRTYYLGIRPGSRTDPFEEIQYQCFHGVRQ